MSETQTLAELAAIVRSKNAGPFRLTFDILFDDEPAFLAVVAADVITPDNVAAAFGVDPAQVSSIHVLPEGLAIKVTLLRPRAQCAAGETDVYGCQQHVPLMTLPVPIEGNYSPPDDSATAQS